MSRLLIKQKLKQGLFRARGIYFLYFSEGRLNLFIQFIMSYKKTSLNHLKILIKSIFVTEFLGKQTVLMYVVQN